MDHRDPAHHSRTHHPGGTAEDVCSWASSPGATQPTHVPSGHIRPHGSLRSRQPKRTGPDYHPQPIARLSATDVAHKGKTRTATSPPLQRNTATSCSERRRSPKPQSPGPTPQAARTADKKNHERTANARLRVQGQRSRHRHRRRRIARRPPHRRERAPDSTPRLPPQATHPRRLCHW